MSVLGDNLKKAREAAGLTRKDVAAALNMTAIAYGSYERGDREPDIQKFVALADILHTTPNDLLGVKGEERDLFAECKRLIESVAIDGEPLLVSKTRHLGEKEYSGVVIQRGGELGYPFVRFASRAEFIAFVQGIMHDFEQSVIYLNARRQFIEIALRREEQRRTEENRQKRKSARPEDYERVLQYLQGEDWIPRQGDIAEQLKKLFTAGLRKIENNPRASLADVMKQTRGKKEPIGVPPEDKATNRPPASQGVTESGHPGDDVAKSHPVEDDAPKQGVTESPTPEAAPPEQEAPKPRRKRQKNSAPSKNETPSK